MRSTMYVGFLLAVLACSEASPEEDGPSRCGFGDNGLLVVSEDEAFLYGEISERFRDCFENVLAESDIRLLKIASNGGSYQMGHDLGQFISARNIDIEIEGLCASACALFLVTAADRIFVDRGDLILFHHSAIALKEYAKPDQNSHLIEEAVAIELSHLTGRSTEIQNLFIYPFIQMGVRCITISTSDEENIVKGNNFVSKYSYAYKNVSYNSEYLQSAGLKVVGELPKDRDDFLTMRTKAELRSVEPEGSPIYFSPEEVMPSRAELPQSPAWVWQTRPLCSP
ncbi:MAG: hypothetical protein WA906_00670 [Pacificimonas sp.]